jgi:hypothetical protein
MEIPRIWRESPVRMQFSVHVEQMTDSHWRYKYPGGEIYFESIDYLVMRMVERGFEMNFIESEMVRLFGLSVASESTVSADKL